MEKLELGGIITVVDDLDLEGNFGMQGYIFLEILFETFGLEGSGFKNTVGLKSLGPVDGIGKTDGGLGIADKLMHRKSGDGN